MSFRDPITGALRINDLKEIGYSHAAMIDLLIASPAITQNEIASFFGYTPAWVSTVINSDAFQGALQERRAEIINPALIATIEERFKAVAQLSLERVLERLTLPNNLISDDFLINSAKLASTALGYGAKPIGGGSTQVGVVINLPGVAMNSTDWAARHRVVGQVVASPQVPVLVDRVIDHEVPVRGVAVPPAPSQTPPQTSSPAPFCALTS